MQSNSISDKIVGAKNCRIEYFLLANAFDLHDRIPEDVICCQQFEVCDIEDPRHIGQPFPRWRTGEQPIATTSAERGAQRGRGHAAVMHCGLHLVPNLDRHGVELRSRLDVLQVTEKFTNLFASQTVDADLITEAPLIVHTVNLQVIRVPIAGLPGDVDPAEDVMAEVEA